MKRLAMFLAVLIMVNCGRSGDSDQRLTPSANRQKTGDVDIALNPLVNGFVCRSGLTGPQGGGDAKVRVSKNSLEIEFAAYNSGASYSFFPKQLIRMPPTRQVRSISLRIEGEKVCQVSGNKRFFDCSSAFDSENSIAPMLPDLKYSSPTGSQ